MSRWGGRKVANMRAEVVATYGNRCHLCRGLIDLRLRHPHPGSLTPDHLVPRSLGGPDTLDNLRPAHRRCNLSRGNRPAALLRPPRRAESGASFFRDSTREAPPATSVSPRNPEKNGEKERKHAERKTI